MANFRSVHIWLQTNAFRIYSNFDEYYPFSVYVLANKISVNIQSESFFFFWRITPPFYSPSIRAIMFYRDRHDLI